MIAADTSSLSALLKGTEGSDTKKIEAALLNGDLRLPPVVLTEILSDPSAAQSVAEQLVQVELLEPFEGYWRRAGEARRQLKKHGVKAKIADALIAQSCLDYDVA